MSDVPVGPSTKATLWVIAGLVVSFVVAWANSGTAPVWMAGMAAGLTAVLSAVRSWQAVAQEQVPFVVTMEDDGEDDDLI
jgi:hypothetical protein